MVVHFTSSRVGPNALPSAPPRLPATGCTMWPRRLREDLADALPGRKRQRGALVHGCGRSPSSPNPPRDSGPTAATRFGGVTAAGDSGDVPPALPGLRAGAPGRQAYRRGSLPNLAEEEAREAALEEFERAVYAQGTLDTHESLLNTAQKLLDFWQAPLLPLTVRTVRRLGAGLKAGGYRSAPAYLSVVRQAAERAGQVLTPDVELALKDARRACLRGVGPAHRVEGLPLARLHELPDDPAPWAIGGPRAPKRAIILGSWWLTREIELANARAAHVQFAGDPIDLIAAWALPVSKADQEARGRERRHGCTCGRGQFAAMCPAHLMWRHRAALRAWFPERHSSGGVPLVDLPLFPDAAGNPCTKQGMVDTVARAAALLGLPLRTPDGLPCWTGHSLRVGGAQGLALAGLDSWAIQLLGRWGSLAVLGYIRDAPLAGSHAWAAVASDGATPQRLAPSATLEDLVAGCTRVRGAAPRPRGAAASPSTPAPVSKESDVEALAARVGGLELDVAHLRELLDAEVQSQAARQAAVHSPGAPLVLPEAAPEAQAEKEAAAPCVRNAASGIVHAVLLRPGISGPQGVAFCSWQFSLGINATLVDELPDFHKDLCERCYPARRGQRKRLAGEHGTRVNRQLGASPRPSVPAGSEPLRLAAGLPACASRPS